MVSISAMKGQGTYYAELARQDYYTAGGKPPGRWLGSGAGALGLVGRVEQEHLHRLTAGFAPDRKQPLIQNAGRKNHQSGWDLTFSAPKPVSVLWSQATPARREQIEEAHRIAVEKSVRYLEDTACFSRRGKGGAQREPAQLV